MKDTRGAGEIREHLALASKLLEEKSAECKDLNRQVVKFKKELERRKANERLMACTMKAHKGIEMVEDKGEFHCARVICSICDAWIVWIFTKAEAKRFNERSSDRYKEVFYPNGTAS